MKQLLSMKLFHERKNLNRTSFLDMISSVSNYLVLSDLVSVNVCEVENVYV